MIRRALYRAALAVADVAVRVAERLLDRDEPAVSQHEAVILYDPDAETWLVVCAACAAGCHGCHGEGLHAIAVITSSESDAVAAVLDHQLETQRGGRR